MGVLLTYDELCGAAGILGSWLVNRRVQRLASDASVRAEAFEGLALRDQDLALPLIEHKLNALNANTAHSKRRAASLTLPCLTDCAGGVDGAEHRGLMMRSATPLRLVRRRWPNSPNVRKWGDSRPTACSVHPTDHERLGLDGKPSGSYR